MNERELFKLAADSEYKINGADLSAEEVLGTSVSRRAAIRTGGWRIGIAALAAAAVTVGAAVYLNSRSVPLDDEAESVAASHPADDPESSAAPEQQAAPVNVASAKESFTAIFEDMKQYPDSYAAYSDYVYEESGVFHDYSECNYLHLPDENHAYTRYTEVEPTSVSDFAELMLENLDKAEYGIFNAEDIPNLYPYEEKKITFYNYAKPNPDGSTSEIIYRMTHKQGDIWTVKVDDGRDFTLTFDVTRQPYTDYLFGEDGIPALNPAVVKSKSDDVPVSFENGFSYTYSDDHSGLTSDIDVSLDKDDNRITVVTSTSRAEGSADDLTIKGTFLIPAAGWMAREKSGAKLISFKMDGEAVELNSIMINPYPNIVPDRTETFPKGETVTHRYELTFEGDISTLDILNLGSLYDTVPDPEADGLAEHLGGGVVFRFS